MSFQLKQYILDKIDQSEIFAKYLGIDKSEIHYCIINTNEKIKNPLRDDSDPSLGFKWYGDKLIARDFADKKYRGDIFQIVGIVLDKNCNNPSDFVDICSDIIDNCTGENRNKSRVIKVEHKIHKKEHLDIEFISRRFNKSDYKFYENQGITEEYVDAYIRCADSYFLNGWKAPYKYKTADPCYVYDVNPNCLKLYFPYRGKRDTRFITNNRIPIECIDEITQNDYLFITKAFKEKILFHRMMNHYNLKNINVIPLASESAVLTDDIYNLLKSRTNIKIFSILDTDKAGIESMLSMENQFNIEPIFFTQGYNAKDPTDMVKETNYKTVLNRFGQILDIILK